MKEEEDEIGVVVTKTRGLVMHAGRHVRALIICLFWVCTQSSFESTARNFVTMAALCPHSNHFDGERHVLGRALEASRGTQMHCPTRYQRERRQIRLMRLRGGRDDAQGQAGGAMGAVTVCTRSHMPYTILDL